MENNGRKTILEVTNPVTQTIDSGKALAKFLGLKEEMPQTIRLANGAQLTLSTKKDCYYVTSLQSCTCKAGQYRRACKHIKNLQSECAVDEAKSGAKAYQAKQRMIRNMAKLGYSQPDEDSPEVLVTGGFKPVLE